jgi:asparagine synthase (glutamine-hydrolysing)
MSAICGLFGKVAAAAGAGSESSLGRMLGALAARGPDGEATHLDAQAPLALGLRHLAVSAGGGEPAVFASEDGALRMVCDGHVFNRDELTAWLRDRGHLLRTNHSAEVLLHLFEEEGENGFRRADAQFALAIWDRQRNRLVLGRDYLGVRSLYYSAGPDGVLFASEVKSILRHPKAPRAVDEAGVSHFLTFLTVPGPRTLFAGINKLPPGTCATCTPDGNVTLRRFWSLLDEPVAEKDDLNYYVDRTRELHGNAVRRRGGEGPIAALVSGGNDSSANAAYMARFGNRPLYTFTVGLEHFEGDPKYNDMAYARMVADGIGSKHHEMLLTTRQFLDTIPVTVEAMDDMVSEPSSVFLHHALRMAAESGAKVVVTGEANDELTCGHGEMIRIRDGYYRRWAPYMQKPRWLRRLAAAAVPLVSAKRRDVLRRAAADEEYFWNFETAWMDSDKASILSPATWERVRHDTAFGAVALYGKELRATEHGRRDYLNYMVYVMMQDYYFGNHMLGKLDLLAGALGIEARCPYTDPAYAHWVYNVPAKFKFHEGTVKYFFKKAIEGVLPDEIIYRPKQGFRTPVVELFQNVLGDWARPVLLDGGLTKAGVLRRDTLERLLAEHRQGGVDYSSRLWTAMVLNLWYERWVRGEGPAQPTAPLRRAEHAAAPAGGAGVG